MRNAFSSTLINTAQKKPNTLLLTGDHGYALFDDFKKTVPNQFINAGVAEQNMVGVAAGLAKIGFKPFVYGLSSFIPIRVLEQIKIDVCYENLPVVLIGDGAGVVYSTLGFSHQSTEDIASLRALPNIRIFSPADAYEMTVCMEMAAASKTPAYLRMGKSDIGNIYKSNPNLQQGQLSLVKGGGGDIALIATGSMVKIAIDISDTYKNSSVWSAPFIKPLDVNHIITLIKQYRHIITLEEHSVFGGLGSAIAELSTSYYPTNICRIGVNDRFSKLCGSYHFLMQEHELDFKGVKNQIDNFLLEHSR